MFLIPHKLLTGGVSGLSMIFSYLSDVSVITYYLAMNVPLLIIGWFLVGRRFIVYSIVSVVATTVLLKYIPVKIVAFDPLLSAVYAGVLLGIGSGIALRVGGSSGGFDILGAIITRYKDVPLGNLITCLNAVVVFVSGYVIGDWNLALASAICLFISGRVMNFIHTEHEKVTVHIITDKSDEMIAELFKLHKRGITKLVSQGAYSSESRYMLMTVVTRYELIEVKDTIRRVDDQAFVNITETLEIMGNFRKRNVKA
jgi:uncharacterized membrane-anchored protein YitT (DUF2179 family)